MSNYAADFRAFVLANHGDKPTDSTVYSGSTRIHYGLSNPTMRDFVRVVVKR